MASSGLPLTVAGGRSLAPGLGPDAAARLARLEHELRNSATARDAANAICRTLRDALAADRIALGSIERDGAEVLILCQCTADGLAPLPSPLRPLPPTRARWNALAPGEVAVVADVAQDPALAAPALQALYRATSVRATLEVPLFRAGRLVALLAAQQATPRGWTAAEIMLTREVLERGWQAIERARAEAARDVSEAQLNAAADALPALMFISDHEGNIHVNQAYCDYTGLPREALLASRWTAIMHPDDVEASRAGWAKLAEGRTSYQSEARFRRHDGAWRWHLVRAVPVLAGPGATRQWVGTCTDIHDSKVAEAELEARVARAVAERETALAQLHEAQKLETLGQLTGGVAHDFNNLLTPILGALDMLSRRLKDDDRTLRVVTAALQSAERARVLVQRLLAFGRRQALEVQPVAPAALVAGMLDLLERSLGPQVSIATAVPETLPMVAVDPNQCELALLNLCVNGRDAMAGGGRLAIGGAVIHDPDGLAAGDYVGLSVTDSGAGMPPEVLARATEPFFTTKAIGEGTGLGLSMVHGFAAQSGGALRLLSAPGRGTTATLLLPVVP